MMNVTVSAGIDFCFSPALTPPNHTARNSESPHLLGEFRFPVIRKKKKSNHSAMIFFFLFLWLYNSCRRGLAECTVANVAIVFTRLKNVPLNELTD